MTTLLTRNELLETSPPAPPEVAEQRDCRQSYWALIDRSDEALLDFDADELDHDDMGHARKLLALHPELYGNHLTIAKFLEGWITRLTNDATPCEFNNGFVEALDEIITHLRDGDFVTGPDDEDD